MKKTLIALAAVQLFSIGVANAIETRETTFTVSVPPSQPNCGLNTNTPSAQLGDQIEFTVVGPNNGLNPMVRITKWETERPDGITSDIAVLENIGYGDNLRPVIFAENQTEAKDFFILKKRDGATIPQGAADAQLTMELTCYDDKSSSDVDAHNRASQNFSRFNTLDELNAFNLQLTNISKILAPIPEVVIDPSTGETLVVFNSDEDSEE